MANVAGNEFLGSIDLRIISATVNQINWIANFIRSHRSCDCESCEIVLIEKVVSIASDTYVFTSCSVMPIVILSASTVVVAVEIVIFGIVIFGNVICLVPDFDMHRTAGFR